MLCFVFECYGDHRDLHVLTHSFPTRRSSDLEVNVQSALNVPLGDTAALRGAGTVQRRDGFVRNVYTGEDLYAYERYGVRARLLWEPTDRLSVLLTGDYRRSKDNANGAWKIGRAHV